MTAYVNIAIRMMMGIGIPSKYNNIERMMVLLLQWIN